MKAPTIKTYLETLDKLQSFGAGINGYRSVIEFLLKHGQAFTPQMCPAAYPRGKMRECYRNAAQLVLGWPGLTYCEGYALNLIPTFHAWAVDGQGCVIDPTWGQGMEYFGIPIQHDYLVERLLAQGVYELMDRGEDGWPMLRDPAERWLKNLTVAAGA